MTKQQLIGRYAIEGTNQDAQASPYKGYLKLSLDSFNRIIAQWDIGDSQTQRGIGFMRDNVIVINFSYTGDDDMQYDGVVVYTCVSNHVLDGFWSEKQGDPLFLGSERCFRLGLQKEVLD